MKKLQVFLGELQESDLERIEELAGQNFAPSDICRILDFDKWAFMQLWRNRDSTIRQRYELGRLNIEETKQRELITKINSGNSFAIQMHDKLAARRTFENIKSEIFNLG
ncbi:hypothetical protein L0P88_04000 [Muricauda sp. SCSIO 64092]|uniref:hypothetical protein n=1 Tax=Allomuricauda sp. SCSIO 64092 TaxID=2908842 RepID=UPI001FF4C7DF|nr:hypothetical protein [Muricauda sp. SCSIO 64092]UOY07717.1 hypothetical protein L0P88_04000 [Muricauda sp. SCSIO 64092]